MRAPEHTSSCLPRRTFHTDNCCFTCAQECPADQPSYDKLDIYSALRDPTSGDVRLFLEYYVKHASQMSEEEQKEAWPAFSDIFAGCAFSDARDFADSVEVDAKRVSGLACHHAPHVPLQLMHAC